MALLTTWHGRRICRKVGRGSPKAIRRCIACGPKTNFASRTILDDNLCHTGSPTPPVSTFSLYRIKLCTEFLADRPSQPLRFLPILKLAATIATPIRKVSPPTIVQNCEPVMKLPGRISIPCINQTNPNRATITPISASIGRNFIAITCGIYAMWLDYVT